MGNLTVSHPSPEDSDLIANIRRCITLNQQHAQAIIGDGAEDSPEACRIDDELCQLTLAVRRTPAQTLDGMMAKADLFFELSDHGKNVTEYMADDHALDPELLAQSMSMDLLRFSGHID